MFRGIRIILVFASIALTTGVFRLAGIGNSTIVALSFLTIAVWGTHALDQPEHLWVLVGQLRRKLEVDPAQPRLLVSEPWVGYRLVSAPPAD
ncbi:MAG: winged helix-turn-helix domain-containing protein [Vicinamibacterales bacterium]